MTGNTESQSPYFQVFYHYTHACGKHSNISGYGSLNQLSESNRYHGCTSVWNVRKESQKTRFHPALTVYFFSALSTRALSGYLVEVFSGPSLLSLFGADSLSRSVHYAPDEKDRPSKQTKIFKLTSVHVPFYALVSSLELNNSET